MIRNAFLMCEGPAPWGYTLCLTLLEIESAHASREYIDVFLPPLTVPDLSRPTGVHEFRKHRIATNGIYAVCLVRARGDVTLVEAPLDRAAMLATHPNLIALERALIAQGVAALSKECLARWTAICADPIDERHRRLSLLRAQLQSSKTSDAHLPVERIVQRINDIIAEESRRAWA
jgi:hypothetical protein